jgi:hypothetical protein
MTSLATKAALIAALLALAGCKDLNEGMNLLEGKPADAADVYEAGSPVIAEIIAAEEPRYVVLDGTGPMGEEIATGPDCHPSFRVRICV